MVEGERHAEVGRGRCEVRRLAGGLIGDFRAVHWAANGSEWCQCVAWWTPSWEGWGERTEAENAGLRNALFARGEFDGYLLYEDTQPIGWCQVGAAERLKKLCRAYEIAPPPDTQAISCFFLAPTARHRGLAHVLLREVLVDLQRRGCRRVPAFPRPGNSLPEDVWTGPEKLYRAAGFRDWRADEKRPILERTLDSTVSGDPPEESGSASP